MISRNSSGTENIFRPKKSFGQNFLFDNRICHQIAALSGFDKTSVVLEIGPGKGALTLPLAKAVNKVIAVEKDFLLIPVLKDKLSFSGIDNVILVNQDILKWDFNEISQYTKDKIHVAGNLPYNISSPVLEKLIDNRGLISRAVLMFQSELGLRLTASPGGKIYGAMTILTEYYAKTKKVMHVSKDAFRPKPKVNSLVLELDFNEPYKKRALDDSLFKNVVKGAFAHRRKTLYNSLKMYQEFNELEGLSGIMEKCGIDPARRAETLDIEEFLNLSDALKLTNCPSNHRLKTT